MSNKRLDTSGIINELKTGSVFFQDQDSRVLQTEKPKEEPVSKSNHDTMQPRNHDTVVSRYHDTTVEEVRKTSKEIGKEAATHRFTVEEKQKIGDIVYSYKRLGIRTSENEITRIAINFVINDHKNNGSNSILDLVLKALNE